MLLVQGPHTEIHCAKILLNFGKECMKMWEKAPFLEMLYMDRSVVKAVLAVAEFPVVAGNSQT